MNPNSASPRRRLILGGLALGVVLLGVFTLPLEQWLTSAVGWQAQHPVLAALFYVLGVTVATPLMVPGSVLMMSGGFVFGWVGGAALAAIGVTLGAALACLAGRSIARPAIRGYTEGNAQFNALNGALTKRGFLVVVLTRLSLLIPFNVLNYAYGVTNIDMKTFIPATALGMLPVVGLFAYIGSLASDVDALLASDAGSGAMGRVIVVVGLIAIVAATYVIHKTATRELKRQMAQNDRQA